MEKHVAFTLVLVLLACQVMETERTAELVESTPTDALYDSWEDCRATETEETCEQLGFTRWVFIDYMCVPWANLRTPTDDEMRNFLAKAGARDLDNLRNLKFSIDNYGPNKGVWQYPDQLWVMTYEITDSSGDYIPVVSGVRVDMDTCDATLIKAQ